IARGGRMVAPPAEHPVQVIDARDLAQLTLDAIEQRVPGVYNAAPAPGSQTIGTLVEAARAVVLRAGGTPAEVIHVPGELLLEQGIEPWDDLPAWLPPGWGHDGMVTASIDALTEAFPHYRPRPLGATFEWLGEWIASGAAGEPPT